MRATGQLGVASILSALWSALGVLGHVGTPLPDAPLRAFQVQQPLLVPSTEPCDVVLIRHLFANSYGQPAVADYRPPSECGPVGSWSSVVVNVTATSNGTQYDRLASLYLNGTEIFRTSTPEPTPKGIIWTALKDITHYSALLSKSGTLVFDLGNLLDSSSGLTGEYDVILSASFYPDAKTFSKPKVADVILPIAQSNTSQASNFHVPPAAQANLSLPQNGAQAFVEIYASGNADEEFWYGNVPDEFFSKLPPWKGIDGYAVGKGPFREVQLMIDSQLAGVIFPYPVIYTGEFLPSIWRPMVSYGAFDSPTYWIDVTPFLPLLSDGRSHNFTLNVAGMGTNHSINSDWIVSGNVQIWLDPSSRPTKGRITHYAAAPFADLSVTGTVEGPAPNVSVTTTAARRLSIAGEVVTGSGARSKVTWTQSLKNTEIYTVTSSNISTQRVSQISSGSSQSTHGSIVLLNDAFTYPLDLYLTYNQSTDAALYDYGVNLTHSHDRDLAAPGIRSRTIKTTQNSEGTQYKHGSDTRIRTGRTDEEFSYVDAAKNTFTRRVAVDTLQNTTNQTTIVTASLIYDRRGGSLIHGGLSDYDVHLWM